MERRWKTIISQLSFIVTVGVVTTSSILKIVIAVEISFLKEEYNAYIHHYKTFPGPLQNVSKESMFLLGKGASLAVEEFNKKFAAEYRLRYLQDVKRRPNTDSVIYGLHVESQKEGIIGATFEAKIRYMSNETIAFSLLKADILNNSSSSMCDKLSSEAKCTECTIFGRCVKGNVPVDPWLDFALKTQQEIQIDEEFTMVQMPAAHNAFNDRADDYGELDDCPWPPPYEPECISLANQEFSFTDMLNMGIRSMEIDPWWCFDEMRMSHATGHALGCGITDRRFEDGIKEVGEWVHKPENLGKVIRIYFEDGEEHTQGHDDLINGPIGMYLGDRVFTPTDLKALGHWPTLRQMRQMNKTVLITTAGTYDHGGVYIQKGYWNEYIENDFTPYPECGGHTSNTSILRYYCDSTNYGPFWNGPKETGVILDFTEFMKCGIQYPAADQVSPMLLRTAVWTWAKGQPYQALSPTSCVYLNGTDHRWYLSAACQTSLPSACVNTTDNWVMGAKGSYGQANNSCPKGYKFSLPVNGFKQQKLIEASHNETVWINLTPYIPLLSEE